MSLTALGIGAVIGSGIFTVIGTAIAGQQFPVASIENTPLIDYFIRHTAMVGRPGSGPALALSLVLVAIVCAFTGLCYAELASMIPIAGSAYTYTYATMGELIAWIIGWDLILEYAFSNMSVSVGFAAHVVDLLDWFNIHPALKWISPAYLPEGLQDLAGNDLYPPGWHFGFNIPAFLIVLLLTVVLVRGIRESAEANNIMVLVKIAAILIFVSFGASFIQPKYYHPFSPNGWSGVLTGGSIIFFTYIGFDSVSTAAEECKNPQRTVPIGILATLFICTILYIGVAVVLTGLVPWKSMMGDAAPVVNALKRLSVLPGGHRLHWVRLFVVLGALAGMISSILVFQLGQARVWFSMSRDRLLPAIFSHVHPKYQDTCRGDVGGRVCGGDSVGAVGYRHGFEPVEHRNAVRFCAGFGGGADPAVSRPASTAGISGSAGAGVPGAQHHLLRGADDGAGSDDVDPVFRVAGDRAGDLLRLQPTSQRIRPTAASQLADCGGAAMSTIRGGSRFTRLCISTV